MGKQTSLVNVYASWHSFNETPPTFSMGSLVYNVQKIMEPAYIIYCDSRKISTNSTFKNRKMSFFVCFWPSP